MKLLMSRIAAAGAFAVALAGAGILSTPAAWSAPTAAQKTALRQACKPDYEALCSGVSPGGGRIVKCLAQNEAKLSPPCQQALAAVQAAQGQ